MSEKLKITPHEAVTGGGRGLVQRARRYAGTWIWLLRQGCRRELRLLLLAVVFGIGSRFGELLGFVASIRTAVWILKPETVPERLLSFLNVTPSILVLILIAVTGAIFLSTAGAQTLHHWASLRYRSRMSEWFVLEKANKNINGLSSESLPEKRLVADIAVGFKNGYSKIFTAQTLVLNLLVSSISLFVTLILGMFIDWFLMGVTMSVALVFSAAFIILRHTQSLVNSENQQYAKVKERAAVKDFISEVKQKEDPLDLKQSLRARLDTLSDKVSHNRQLEQSFATDSTLAVNIGKAVIVVVFLSLLLGNSIDHSKVTQLVILAFIFRFAISYVQAIVQTLIKLSPNYPFLVEFRQSLESTPTEPVSAVETGNVSPTQSTK